MIFFGLPQLICQLAQKSDSCRNDELAAHGFCAQVPMSHP